jgi:molybdopterin molybdotransferase
MMPNRFQLMAWLQTRGAQVMDGGILPDDLARTEAALGFAAKKFDVIITSGGASVGEADYLKQAIQNAGTLIEHSIAIKPGKPFAWGSIGSAKVFVLPGNPVATFVTAHMLLFPVLNKLMGKEARYWRMPAISATAAFSTRKAIKRREFLRVEVGINEAGRHRGHPVAQPRLGHAQHLRACQCLVRSARRQRGGSGAKSESVFAADLSG